MYDEIEASSSIRIGDFCDYHFDRDVELVWGGKTNKETDTNWAHYLLYFEQRYDCQRR
jgi:hypothetical protein